MMKYLTELVLPMLSLQQRNATIPQGIQQVLCSAVLVAVPGTHLPYYMITHDRPRATSITVKAHFDAHAADRGRLQR